VTEIVFKSARKWLDAMIAHQCGREKKMIAADDPNPRREMFGFVCQGCEDWFLIRVSSLQRTKDSLTQKEWEMIDTASGRRMMTTWYFMGTVVQVRDEVEL